MRSLNPKTRIFETLLEAAQDASTRGTTVWEHHSYGAWARDCGLSPFVTGSHDGLVRDMGHGTAGAYVFRASTSKAGEIVNGEPEDYASPFQDSDTETAEEMERLASKATL